MTSFRLFLGLILPVAGFLIQCTNDERSNPLDPNSPEYVGKNDPDLYERALSICREDTELSSSECVKEAEKEIQRADSLITLTVNGLRDGDVVGSSVFLVSGKIRTVNELKFIRVTVNESLLGFPIPNGEDWQIEVQLEADLNLIEIAAEDEEGNTSSKTLTLYYDPNQVEDLQPPVLKAMLKGDSNITILNNTTVKTGKSPTELFGTIKDESGVNLKMTIPADAEFQLNDTSWTATANLVEGLNLFVLEGSDNAEPPNDLSFVFNLNYEPAGMSIRITEPDNNAEVNRADSLRVVVTPSGDELPDSVSVNGVNASDSNGLWVAYVTITPNAATLLKAEAKSESGETASDSITITHSADPDDNQEPTINLVSPQNGSVVNDTSVLVQVTVTDASGVSKVELKADSETTPMTDKGNGNYEATLPLDPNGATTFTILAEDNSPNSNSASQTYSISANPDKDPPEITFASHHDSQAVTNKKPTVRFSVDDPSGLDDSDSVRINSEVAAYNEGQGVYEKEVVLIDTGFTVIKVTAADTWGNKDTVEFRLRYDGTGPEITVNSPENNATVNEPRVEVRVSASDPSTVEGVLIDEETADLSDGIYSRTVSLSEGENTIPIAAQDSLKNTTQASLVVNYVDNTGPDFHQLSIQDGETLYNLNPTFQVTVQDASGVAQVLINDQPVASSTQGDVYSAQLQLTEGENTITVVATDSAATPNSNQVEVTVTAVDTTGPKIEIISPRADTIFDEAFTTVVVSARDPSGLEDVFINNEPANPGPEEGTYQLQVALARSQLNTITIQATDDSEAGNTTEDTLSVFQYISLRSIEVEDMTMFVGDTSEPVITWTPVDATDKSFYLRYVQEEPPAKIRIVDSTKVEALAFSNASFVTLHSLAREGGNFTNVAFSVTVLGVDGGDSPGP